MKVTRVIGTVSTTVEAATSKEVLDLLDQLEQRAVTPATLATLGTNLKGYVDAQRKLKSTADSVKESISTINYLFEFAAQNTRYPISPYLPLCEARAYLEKAQSMLEKVNFVTRG